MAVEQLVLRTSPPENCYLINGLYKGERQTISVVSSASPETSVLEARIAKYTAFESWNLILAAPTELSLSAVLYEINRTISYYEEHFPVSIQRLENTYDVPSWARGWPVMDEAEPTQWNNPIRKNVQAVTQGGDFIQAFLQGPVMSRHVVSDPQNPNIKELHVDTCIGHFSLIFNTNQLPDVLIHPRQIDFEGFQILLLALNENLSIPVQNQLLDRVREFLTPGE